MIRNLADEEGVSINEVTNSEEIWSLITKWLKPVNDELLGRVTRVGTRKIQWWNPDLERMKKAVRACRLRNERIIKRGRDPTDARRRLNEAEREYKWDLIRAKRDSWREFVGANANENPWDVVYKICRDKNRRREIGPLKVGGRYTNDWAESIEILLERFFPVVNENLGERLLDNRGMEVTAEDVRCAIWSLAPDKDP